MTSAEFWKGLNVDDTTSEDVHSHYEQRGRQKRALRTNTFRSRLIRKLAPRFSVALQIGLTGQHCMSVPVWISQYVVCHVNICTGLHMNSSS